MSTQMVKRVPGARLIRSKPQKKSKRRALILLLLLLFLLTTALVLIEQPFGILKIAPPTPILSGDLFPAVGAGVDSGTLGGMTPEQIKEQMQKVADASQFSFKINSSPRFLNGKSQGDLWIENPSYNVYPMVVQIFLDDTQEIVYDSGGIMPNQHISYATLLKELPQGTHKATAYINAYDPDTKVFQGRSAAKINLIIEN